jgi:hypothetical protein
LNSPHTSTNEIVPPIPNQPLPPQWKTATTEDGKVYYYNLVTRQTQWEFPKDPLSAEQIKARSSIMEGVSESDINAILEQAQANAASMTTGVGAGISKVVRVGVSYGHLKTGPSFNNHMIDLGNSSQDTEQIQKSTQYGKIQEDGTQGILLICGSISGILLKFS